MPRHMNRSILGLDCKLLPMLKVLLMTSANLTPNKLLATNLHLRVGRRRLLSTLDLHLRVRRLKLLLGLLLLLHRLHSSRRMRLHEPSRDRLARGDAIQLARGRHVVRHGRRGDPALAMDISVSARDRYLGILRLRRTSAVLLRCLLSRWLNRLHRWSGNLFVRLTNNTRLLTLRRRLLLLLLDCPSGNRPGSGSSLRSCRTLRLLRRRGHPSAVRRGLPLMLILRVRPRCLGLVLLLRLLLLLLRALLLHL